MQGLYQKKWQKFLRRGRLFNFIPFVDFVLAAGSLATGDVREDSDFDVIVGVRQGRIFTARAFCIAVFGLLGWRRKKISGHPMSLGRPAGLAQNYRNIRISDVPKIEKNKDKFCFSHFVAPKAYRFSPPYNEYWKMLYQKLVPVYGRREAIQKFFDANADWIEGSTSQILKPIRKEEVEPRKVKENPSILRGRTSPSLFYKSEGRINLNIWEVRPLEFLLSGRFGDWLEKKLKAIQVRRIERSLKITELYKPRVIYNDNELEFHPDTKRIEEYCKK